MLTQEIIQIELQIIDLINDITMINPKISLPDIDEPFTGSKIGLSGDNLYDLLRTIEQTMNVKIVMYDYYFFYNIRNAAKTIYQAMNDPL